MSTISRVLNRKERKQRIFPQQHQAKFTNFVIVSFSVVGSGSATILKISHKGNPPKVGVGYGTWVAHALYQSRMGTSPKPNLGTIPFRKLT